MRKYCRYCVYCAHNNIYYCGMHEKQLGRIDKAVECDEFVESEFWDIDTGRRYKQREQKYYIQLSLFDELKNEDDISIVERLIGDRCGNAVTPHVLAELAKVKKVKEYKHEDQSNY